MLLAIIGEKYMEYVQTIQAVRNASFSGGSWPWRLTRVSFFEGFTIEALDFTHIDVVYMARMLTYKYFNSQTKLKPAKYQVAVVHRCTY